MKENQYQVITNTKKYQYHVITKENLINVPKSDTVDTQEEFLNKYGQDGWELCHWERYNDVSTYIFKKEIIEI